MKRKMLCTTLAIMMASSLIACGSSKSSDGAGTEVAANTQGDMENAVITIWSPSDKESIENWWAEKIDEWNAEHPDMLAAREAIDRSDSYAYDNKIATAVTSNDLPSFNILC